MRLSHAVNDLVTAAIADGRSRRTVGDYQQKLQRLVDFLDDKPIEEVTTSDLRSYAAHLRTRSTRYDSHPNRNKIEGGLAQASVAGYLRVLRRLFRFAEAEGWIRENPAKAIRIPKPKRGEPKAISTQDFSSLLQAVQGDTVNVRRNRAMLLVLADTACRVGGLVGMRLSDLDLVAGKVYLHEKGNKGRFAFVTPVTIEALQAWLAARPGDSNAYLWTNLGSGGGEHLSTQGVREVFRRLKAKVGVTCAINPHAWRHAFAREYLQNGGDLGSLADIMGHADVVVTHRSYAIFLNDELRAKHAKHSPLANMRQVLAH
jgi:integrase/recombinase XerD